MLFLVCSNGNIYKTLIQYQKQETDIIQSSDLIPISHYTFVCVSLIPFYHQNRLMRLPPQSRHWIVPSAQESFAIYFSLARQLRHGKQKTPKCCVVFMYPVITHRDCHNRHPSFKFKSTFHNLPSRQDPECNCIFFGSSLIFRGPFLPHVIVRTERRGTFLRWRHSSKSHDRRMGESPAKWTTTVHRFFHFRSRCFASLSLIL